jgi:DNA invertase Pin-like site-specific DNA recombinase
MPVHHAYLRVSTRQQLKKTGFNRQLDAIKTFCNPLDSLTIWKEKGISGSLLHRPALDSLFSEARAGETVYIEDLSRLARELSIQLQIIKSFIDLGLRLITVSTGEDVTAAVTNDPMTKAMIQIQGVFAELEKSRLVARMQKGLDLMRDGERNPRRTRTGKVKVEGRLRLTELQPGLLEDALRMQSEGTPNAQISRELHALGYRNRVGDQLSCTAISRILSEGIRV